MADPGQLAKQLLQKNFPLFGTIRQAVTFQSLDPATYDTANGNVADVVASSHALNVIWDSFSFSANSAQTMRFDRSTILSIDKLVIYPALDLPVVAKVGDRIVVSSGVVWAVMAVEYDPALAHYELHVRPWGAT